MSEPTIRTTPKGIQFRLHNDVVDERGYKEMSDLLDKFPDGVLTTNSDVEITALPPGLNVLLVSAPGISSADLKSLADTVSNALKDPDMAIVVNYQINISGRLNMEPSV